MKYRSIEDLCIAMDLRFSTDDRTYTTLIRDHQNKCVYKYYINKNKLHRIHDNAFFFGKDAELEIRRYVDSLAEGIK